MKNIIASLLLIASVPAISVAQTTTSSTPFSYSKVVLNSQTATTNTTLFTPLVDGDYTILVSAECTTAVNSNLTFSLSYTNDNGVQTRPDGVFNCNGAAILPSSSTIHVVAGSPVIFSVIVSSGTSAPLYNAFFTIIGQ